VSIKSFLEDGIHAQIKVIKRRFHYNLGNSKGNLFKRYFYEEEVVTCEKMRIFSYKISLTYLRTLAMVRESRLMAWSLDTPMILSWSLDFPMTMFWSLDIPMTMFWSLDSSMILC
jgi:hypothetical protein